MIFHLKFEYFYCDTDSTIYLFFKAALETANCGI